MVCSEILKARVTPEIKLQVKTLADRELLNESAWLKRLVIHGILAAAGHDTAFHEPCRTDGVRRPSKASRQASGCDRPVLVRFRPEDRLLLDARAAARGMRPATYVSVLTRSHLRKLTPLPKDELLALRRSIGELASIGRNINQIARAANENGKLPGSVREEFRAMLKVCEALRDNTKALLKTNVSSWEAGYAQADL